MSYILDALRKSEQEHTRGQAPDIHVTHDTPPRAERSRRLSLSLITVNVVVALAVAAALFSGNFELSLSPGATSSLQATSSPTTSPRLPAQLEAVKHTRPPAEAASIDRTADRKGAADAIRKLTFSTHIYASDTRLRAVTINGRRLSEGDRIDTDLILLEITQSGVVIEGYGERHTVGVLNDWSS